jgi:preprotein translocase subunit SecG
VLSKATTIAAALFMLTSLSLSILATRGGGGTAPSIFDKGKKAPVTTQQKAPVAPVQPGGTVPIQVTPEANGNKLPTATIPAPVVADPTKAGQSQQKK